MIKFKDYIGLQEQGQFNEIDRNLDALREISKDSVRYFIYCFLKGYAEEFTKEYYVGFDEGCEYMRDNERYEYDGRDDDE